jgi:hypothetical protein
MWINVTKRYRERERGRAEESSRLTDDITSGNNKVNILK